MGERLRIALLGATGSIGTQTVDVCRRFADRFQLVSAAAKSNLPGLRAIANEFPGLSLATLDSVDDSVPSGIEAICDLCTAENVDVVVVAVAGVIGLQPTIAAIKSRKRIALASKEVLVAAGGLIMPLVQEYGVTLTPIDSEHSAVFQCLQGYRSEQVRRILLTASGGPFRGFSRTQLAQVSVAEALNHPTWKMGGKITIDSASMMNKALECIEAKWLFGLEMDQVDVVVHPQSIVHSFVEFQDGSVIGQLGNPDMRLPILYSLTWPERIGPPLSPWNPVTSPPLNFETLDETVFPAIQLARQAVKLGGTAPAVLNGANEEAVSLFLNGKLDFLGIYKGVERAMSELFTSDLTLEGITAADLEARQLIRDLALGANAI